MIADADSPDLTSGKNGASIGIPPGGALRPRRTDLEDRLERRVRDLEHALAENSLLLREQQHRVKNHLQLMTNIVAAQSDRSGSLEVRQALDTIRGRLEALGAVYQVLPRHDAAGVELSQVLHGIAINLAELHDPDNTVELVVDMERVFVDAATGSSLGLVLHELLTNAYEHAFGGQSGGRLSVCLKRIEDGLLLAIEDSGSAARSDSEGLGIPILISLVRQLGGQLDYRKGQEYDVSIHLPATILKEQ